MAKRGNPNLGEAAKRAGTCFGMPNGNKPNGGGFLGGGKTNRQWVSELIRMTAAELKEFAADESKPAVIRKFAIALAKVEDVKDVTTVLDMVESRPAQVVEQTTRELPPILKPIDLTSSETNDCECKDTEA